MQLKEKLLCVSPPLISSEFIENNIVQRVADSTELKIDHSVCGSETETEFSDHSECPSIEFDAIENEEENENEKKIFKEINENKTEINASTDTLNTDESTKKKF